MKESIHKYFQIGTLTWMSFPGMDQSEAVRMIARDDYFDAIELCGCRDDSQRDACRNFLAQSHLTVGYGAHPQILGQKLNPNATDEDERKKAESALLAAIDEAAYLGASTFVFLAGKWQEETKAVAYSQLLKTTRALCDHAGERGLDVELELFDYDVDKAALMGPAPYAAQFAADMRCTHANFGLLVDLSHIPVTHENASFVIRTLRPYLTHLHFGNAVIRSGCPAYGDKHPRFGFPDSANDTPQLLDYLRVLKEEGFFQAEHPLVMSMEVTPFGDEDAQIVLANTKRVLNRAWALLDD